MDVRIRLATPEDARKIAEVHLAAWRPAYRGIISQQYLDSLSIGPRKNRWDEILQRKTEHEKTFVAEIDGEVAGFNSVGPNRNQASDYGGEIYALYLHHSYQKRGIGAALLRNGMGELRRMKFAGVVVWVLKDNPSRTFYGKMGGREVEEKIIRIGEQDLKEVAYAWD